MTMRKLDRSVDYFSARGAEALARHINAYWRATTGEAAHAFALAVDPPHGERYYVVRSAMLGGRPS